MRIVIVSQSYHPRPGGVTEHVHHTAGELRRRGHDVKIITTRFNGGADNTSDVLRVGRNVLVPVNGAWVNLTLGRNLSARLKELLASLRPEVIHTHCPLAPTLPLMTLAVAPRGCRVVGTFHAAARRLLGYRLVSSLWGHLADRIDARIAVSVAARELAESYLPGEYTIIPNGVDCRRFSPSREPIAELCDGAFNVLFVGRMDRRKGLKYLFRAVSDLSRSIERRIRLVVVGDDGARRHLLPRISRRVDVVFAGVVDREVLPRYFTSCDVFCSPATERESFGIVLLEAMASGMPVIGTAIPGYLTLLRNGWNALTVPPRDAAALTAALAVIMRDEPLRTALRRNALSFSHAYRWERVVDQIEATYSQALHSDKIVPLGSVPLRRDAGRMRAQKA